MKLQNELGSLINVELIRAFTPMFIAAIGGAIGLTVLLTNAKAAESGFGLASTAIAGAAGLAQSGKEEDKKPPQTENAVRDPSNS